MGEQDRSSSITRSRRQICLSGMQTASVRAGTIKRPHFAHKHLLDCPLGQDSPELLNARAVLYEWLLDRFKNTVTIEKKFEDMGLPRPVDCWITGKSGSIAFWLVGSQMKPDKRNELTEALRDFPAKMNWICLIQMLHADPRTSGRVRLSTTERELIHKSRYDPIWSTNRDHGGSLHYLDAEHRTLTTFRSLRVVHAPNLFSGHKQTHALSAIQIVRAGELVHPGEQVGLGLWKKRQAEAEKRKKAEIRALTQKVQKRWARTCTKQEHPVSKARKKEAECEFCGQVTSDWWYFNPIKNKCKCQSCYRKGLS